MRIIAMMTLLAGAWALAGCQKCYVCTDRCYTCKLYQADTLADTRQRCSSDSLWSAGQLKTLQTQGYQCDTSKGTYKDEYCTNAEGEDYYLAYHGQGGRYSCSKK